MRNGIANTNGIHKTRDVAIRIPVPMRTLGLRSLRLSLAHMIDLQSTSRSMNRNSGYALEIRCSRRSTSMESVARRKTE